MTPFLLAQIHPRLWHVTAAEAVPSIRARGLLTTADIVALWDVPQNERERLLTRRRPFPVTLSHAEHGPIVISDNAPLSEKKLGDVLDDGLTPADWLRMLNERVFFFADERPLHSLLGAKSNASRPKAIIEIDTRRLAEAYGEAIEIAPINSGNTNYAAQRRGLSTFAPLAGTDYERWQRARGRKQRDTIKEVAVRRSIPDIASFIAGPREDIHA
jgi:hypothetical protein